MDAWAARIAAAGLFCATVRTAADVNAETLALRCSIGGQETSANIDLTNRTIDLGKGVISAEVNNQVISWCEEGALRTINRSSNIVFRQLPDSSFFRSGRADRRRSDSAGFMRCDLSASSRLRRTFLAEEQRLRV